MIRRLLLGLACLCLGAGAATAAAPQRVVSLNLCVDQYLLALADREQIAALTSFAGDPSMSAAAAAAEGLPQIRGAAEEVIRLDPDLVLGGTFTRRETRALLRRMGYRVVDIPAAESFEAIRKTTRDIAALLGHPERGERLVAELDRAVAGAAHAEAVPSALYFQRRGFANGARSLVSEIMATAGLRNAAADMGLQRTGRVDLEAIVRTRPDILLVDSLTPRLEDQGTYMLRHPALAAAVPRDRWIPMPQALVICGGPMTAEAVALLRTETAALR